jgi:ornithine cyclodeaminase/alanine dehydrogenase-like protein (mu-crystallin family)
VIFKSLGLAVEDAVAARLVFEAALAERAARAAQDGAQGGRRHD